MFDNKTIIIISPHIDDSFFSLWYLINNLSNKNINIVIINVFSKTNFTLQWEEYVNLITSKRKNEEKIINNIYKNIIFYYLDFDDAIIRWYKKEDLFIWKQLLKDKNLKYEIEKIINNIINKTKNSLILCPLAYWNHIDHIFLAFIFNDYNNIIYYEDLPYANRNINNYFVNFLKNDLKPILLENINNDDITTHLKIIRYYKSQLSNKHYNEIADYLFNNKLKLWKKNTY